MNYLAAASRYEGMKYRRCGKSGLMLPEISLGLWHNFGDITPFGVQQSLLRTAFDHGITHFDLANNYGPPYGEAERNFGRHLLQDFLPYRDELVISTKAGFDMWAGPYGDHGSRKYLIASLDQSLKRMNLDYVDIFYHHRPDPDTPVEETAGALEQILRSGKALYVGISNYNAEETDAMIRALGSLGTHLLIHQPSYSMMNRHVERPMEGVGSLQEVLRREGVGCICFAPLQNGLLTGRYLNGIPADSRAAHDPRFLTPAAITEERLTVIRALNELAAARGQTLAQMALQWVLRDPVTTSALIGASRPEQIVENIAAIHGPAFTAEELEKIEEILK
ncbi:MAG: L-glyceraldehyde 3-phosphate reductase [Ruminococcaceae bacterium]|nr:L-glyceraldehyde 3-phosphate reductase [Oscillospiraceae bacterium]